MHLSREEIFYLLEVYTSHKITNEEERQLFQWLHEGKEHGELKEFVKTIWESNNKVDEANLVDWRAMYRHIVDEDKSETDTAIPHKNRFLYLTLIKVAAAIFILAFCLTIYLKYAKSTRQSIPVATNSLKDISAPTTVRSILTLSDGRTIALGGSPAGVLATQDNVKIIKDTANDISYIGNNDVATYNRLYVPNGSLPVKLILSDGTKVWLNVGSSLRYPTAFTGKERKVEINGEAYFEVAHNANMPFVVQKNNMNIRVLGTHFDVNAYDDESIAKVNLLEGSVSVNKNSLNAKIKPNQQAQVSDYIKIRNDIDIDEVMAWKSGKFKFGENADIKSVMRQISRWYNINVQYDGAVDQHFWGTMSRNVNISQVLKILEATGSVHFKIDGNTVIVSPSK